MNQIESALADSSLHLRFPILCDNILPVNFLINPW